MHTHKSFQVPLLPLQRLLSPCESRKGKCIDGSPGDFFSLSPSFQQQKQEGEKEEEISQSWLRSDVSTATTGIASRPSLSP